MLGQENPGCPWWEGAGGSPEQSWGPIPRLLWPGLAGSWGVLRDQRPSDLMMGAECEVASEKTEMKAQGKRWQRRGTGQWRGKLKG